MTTSKYDNRFQFHADERDWDWHRLKAQGMSESNLDPDAISSAGAMGLMQFMPKTWRWIWRDILKWTGPIPSPFEPEASIEAGAVYMGILLLKYWGNWRMAWAAYNWGPGNLSKVLQANFEDWEARIPAATRAYLDDIERHLSQL